MTVTIHPGQGAGTLPAIPSKSAAHRLLICAALGDKPTTLACPQSSQDIDATAACLTALGADIQRDAQGFRVTPIPRANAPRDCLLPCGESGSTLRFLLPVAGALGVRASFQLKGRLGQRPMEPLVGQLQAQGCTIEQAPDRLTVSGQLRPGKFTLPGDVSSQFISGLLLALPLLGAESRLQVTGTVESAGYIAMTLRALAVFGLEPEREGWSFTIPPQGFRSPGAAPVEGDWSNAAPWLCMGVLGGTGVSLTGLDPDSLQGDRAVCQVLRAMGGGIRWQGDTVQAAPGPLHPMEIDARNIPDLVPVLSAVAALIPGETRIVHAARLRLKESDRLATTAQTLNALGGQVEETADGLVIQGKSALPGGQADAQGDHRIAMAAAVASAGCTGPVTVTGAQAVEKSYPTFWRDLAALGRNITTA